MLKTVVHSLILIASFSAFGQSSVLQSGKWFKVAVETNGVYRLSYDDFSKMGFDAGSISPQKIQIYGGRGGMLPQPNAIARPSDLVQLSIFVEGESDGKFDRSDFVLFYAEGPDRKEFISSKEVFFYEKNLYADKNFYFVTVSENNGQRTGSASVGSGGNLVTEFNDYIYHELNTYNVLRSGREWFGENFELTPEQTFEFNVSGIVENSSIKIVSEVMSQSYSSSSFKLSYNDQLVGEQMVVAIPNSQYGVKGRIKRDTLVFNASAVNAPSAPSQRLKYTFVPGTSGRSAGYLNYFVLNVKRKLSLYGDQTIFRSASAPNMATHYQIDNLSEGIFLWNITNPFAPVQQEVHREGSVAAFTSHALEDAEEFIVFNNSMPSPELIGNVPNQDLHGMGTPDLLIVTHPDFLAEANRLAEHRRSYNNLNVAVVGTDQVFNEFSSGREDITAIRDLAKFLFDKNPSALKSLMLFGKCSYDYKDRLQTNYNFVPTYESRNSLSPLETFSSDDYFAFLENNEGAWAETGAFDNHTLDIGVGRLPVKSSTEARIVVDKLIAYDMDKKRFGKWRKDIVFVADDGSNSDGFTTIHQSQANFMAEDIEALHPAFNTRKLFLGTYEKKVSPNGETIPQANKDIMEEFSQSVIINYTGHGSETLWADERILTPEEITALKNKVYPFLVTATCEFGRHDDPQEISTAELSVLKEHGGSIGLVTTTRPVNSSTNYALNLAFYEALFQKENGIRLTTGEIFRQTKNNSISGVANRNFALLGDPSLILALPTKDVTVDYIKTESGSDTLKALSKVIVRGHITLANGETDTQFNGVVEATLFDKKTEFRTIGKNDPAFQYDEWFNPLFRGQASVADGAFEFTFQLPKNIAYEVNSGKLSLYATDPARQTDAAGAANTFKVGESELNPPADDESPVLEAFMGDSTFVNGGAVSSNTRLVVKISDKSGINISNYGIGNTMMASLDDDAEVFLINEYFVANQDDFTTGWVNFPISNLAPGKHTLTVKAWDTHNNPGQQTIDFEVLGENSFVIEKFGNFPNPFSLRTTIFFRHNRPGDDLSVQFSLLNAAGAEIQTFNFSVSSSTYEVNLMELDEYRDLHKKLLPGLYFGRIQVRSLSDGAESVAVTKLILTN